MAKERPALPVILAGLCTTQIIAWGILYYAFPVLSARIAADTGWTTASVTVAYSAGLVVSALLGIPVGKVLDRRGPRLVMTAGSVLGVAGLVMIASAANYWVFLAGWLTAGVAMAGNLYPPAFAAVTRWYGARRVFALMMITLIGGLASTVFAPVTEALTETFDWRGVYLVLAAVLGVVAIPVHGVVLRRPWPVEPRGPGHGGALEPDAAEGQSEAAYARQVMRSPAYVLMTVGLTLGGMAMFAAMINLVPMLIERGVSSGLAAWILGLGGLGQVIGRLFYMSLERRLSVRARHLWIYGLLAVSTAALALDATNAVWLIAISMVAGVGRGISTLLKATAVTDRWGPRAYGRLSGVFNAPVMFGIAISPALGAWLAELLGSWEMMYLVLAVIGALAVIALLFSVPRQRPSGAPPQ
ncbi:MFS transporter [Nesterenkonia muleiensis]|uniref:MFS transporter n=1 Tax=Nesterenkonia muleiensis TaxID=2282648 RepID=UPI000E7368E4|nr:MFS transporter [Nesterenkonia muleiensis]